MDKVAKVTLNGGDEIIFRSPVRHAYVSFSIAYCFILTNKLCLRLTTDEEALFILDLFVIDIMYK